jgi:hypothetical protein
MMKNNFMHPADFRKAIRECLEGFNLAAPEIENLFGIIRTLEDRNIFVALDK